MTNCGYGKLGESNLTDFELFDLCYEILLTSKTSLSSSDLTKVLKSDYGKDIPVRRISMKLISDPRFMKKYEASKYGRFNVLMWEIRSGAKNVLKGATTWK